MNEFYLNVAVKDEKPKSNMYALKASNRLLDGNCPCHTNIFGLSEKIFYKLILQPLIASNRLMGGSCQLIHWKLEESYFHIKELASYIINFISY